MYGCVPLDVSMPVGEDETIYLEIEEKLFYDRAIYIKNPITDSEATLIVAKLLTLAMESSTKDIGIYINTVANDISAIMSIINTIEILPCKVHTICLSLADGYAALLLASGTRGYRVAMPHSTINLYQHQERFGGKQSDVTVDYEKFLKDRDKLRRVLSNVTDKTVGEIATLMSSGVCYLDANQAKEFGIIDDIIGVAKNRR